MEVKEVLEWTFFSECEIPQDVKSMLVSEEVAISAYQTFRDCAIFTNKRLIIRDVEGLTGRKKEIFTIPYKSILMYSTENGGVIDINQEIEIWTMIGNLKIKLKKDIDIRKFDNLLAEVVLNG